MQTTVIASVSVKYLQHDEVDRAPSPYLLHSKYAHELWPLQPVAKKTNVHCAVSRE